MLLKEYYQSMHGKIDTRIGRAFAPITEVDDEQMIKYKDNDGESQEMKASSAKTMPMDHPAKVEYDKLDGGDDGGAKKGVNIFDKPSTEPESEPEEKGSATSDGTELDKGLSDWLSTLMEPDPQGDDYAWNPVKGDEGRQAGIEFQKKQDGWYGEIESTRNDPPLDQPPSEPNDGWADTVGDEIAGINGEDSPEDFAVALQKASPEAKAWYAERGIPPAAVPEESVSRKGSFRKIQEQWVNDNLNVL
jgi:hypothetical protein